MKTTILTAAALALGITAFAGASQAMQPNPGPYSGPYNGPNVTIQLGGPIFHQRVLTNQQIRFRLQQQGYHDIRILDRGAFRVTARAEDWRGRDFRLVVNARTGGVISRVALNNPRPFPFPGNQGPFPHGPYGGWNNG